MALSYTCLLCLLLLCTPHGQSIVSRARQPIWEPPKVLDRYPAKATTPKDMTKNFQVSGQRIELETTKLDSLQKALGGVIGHRGDAGDSLSWLCLHGTDSDGTWVLWLLSSEMDDGSVGGFTWQLVNSRTPVDSRCSALTGNGRIVELPINLRLGMTKDQVLLLLGKPSHQSHDTLFYLHERELTLHNQPYTGMNAVRLVLNRKKIVSIEVWKSTTS